MTEVWSGWSGVVDLPVLPRRGDFVTLDPAIPMRVVSKVVWDFESDNETPVVRVYLASE